MAEDKKVLVVVDMQNDFIDGSLGTKEAQALVPRLAEYIRNWKGWIVCTKDTHYDDTYLDTLEGKKLPVKHCIKDTEGWKINEQIDKAIMDATLEEFGGPMPNIIKETFGARGLPIVIQGFAKDIEQIEVCGLCTGICVLANCAILRTHFPNVPITVNAEYTECINPKSKAIALEAMRLLQIRVVGATADVTVFSAIPADMQADLPIGTERTLNGRKVRLVEDTDTICRNCIFNNLVDCDDVHCMSDERTDGKAVHWEYVEE